MYVPETLTGLELLEQFRESHYSLAFIVNRYGGLEGIVTLQDILEALVGEIGEAEGGRPDAFQRDDGSWLLERTMGIDTVSEENKVEYHTVSGLVLLLLGRLPVPEDFVSGADTHTDWWKGDGDGSMSWVLACKLCINWVGSPRVSWLLS